MDFLRFWRGYKKHSIGSAGGNFWGRQRLHVLFKRTVKIAEKTGTFLLFISIFLVVF